MMQSTQSPCKIVISGGANLGEPIRQCRWAVAQLGSQHEIQIQKVSSLYLTEPISEVEQAWIYNFVLLAYTTLAPLSLLECCQNIERAAGRRRTVKNGPRTLDLDIIYYGDRVIQTAELIVPHPRVLQRKFVLIPLVEISPEFMDPSCNRSAHRLLRECQDTSVVINYEQRWLHDSNCIQAS